MYKRQGLDSFALLAIPFFILAGNIMNSGGIALRLIDFAKVLEMCIRDRPKPMSSRRHGGCRTTTWQEDGKWNALERATVEGDSPVQMCIRDSHLGLPA